MITAAVLKQHLFKFTLQLHSGGGVTQTTWPRTISISCPFEVASTSCLPDLMPLHWGVLSVCHHQHELILPEDRHLPALHWCRWSPPGVLKQEV